MTEAAIEERFPGLIDGLARHPGIGAVVVRSAAGQALVVTANERSELALGHPEDHDPLADYGAHAAASVQRLEGFPNAGDLILLGAIDEDTGEVTGFEGLVGSHGGLGGWQTQPFILCPATLSLAEDPPVGAPALYRQLTAWQAQLRVEGMEASRA